MIGYVTKDILELQKRVEYLEKQVERLWKEKSSSRNDPWHPAD